MSGQNETERLLKEVLVGQVAILEILLKMERRVDWRIRCEHLDAGEWAMEHLVERRKDLIELLNTYGVTEPNC